MLRIKKKIHKPCLRCGKLFEKETKRQTICKKCRKLAWKHGGETRQKQYKMLKGKIKYFGIRKVTSFSLPKLGPLVLLINLTGKLYWNFHQLKIME